MKNLTTISLAVVAALSLLGCSKSPSPGSESPLDGEKCSLSLNLGEGEHTRATYQGEFSEFKIQNVQIFVFRKGGKEDGILDACKSVGFDSPIGFDVSSTRPYSMPALECTVGSREIYVVVNGHVDYTANGTVLTRKDLLSNTITLNDGGKEKLFMFGSTTANLVSGAQTHSVTVKRFCANILLESVKNDMLAPAYRKSGAFRIKSVYLINVPARVRFDSGLSASSLSSQDWYAPEMADPNKSTLIYDDVDRALEHGNTYDNKHWFYSFPNECAPSTQTVWCPRATCLVVEAGYKFDVNDPDSEQVFYYPITLYNKKDSTGLEANKRYKVNLTIRRPGSKDPNTPVEFGAVSGSIYVESWEDGTSYTETI